MCQRIDVAEWSVYSRRERIKLLRSPALGDSFVEAAHGCQKVGIAIMRNRARRVEFGRLPEFAFCGSKVPVVAPVDLTKCSMRFSEGRVEFDRSHRGSLRFWQSFCRRLDVKQRKIEIRIGDSSECRRVP